MPGKRTPLLLTDEMHDKIVGTLRLGNYVEHAALYAGISRATLYNWLKKGDVVRNVSIIQQAAQTNWQAAGWWLERTAPQHFGRQMRTEVSGPNQGPVQVQVTRDELIEEITRLLDVVEDVDLEDDA